jgi:hypothetical protein
MKTPIRVGLVGAGMAGQAHAFGYRNAMMAPDLADLNVDLRTIVDANLALAQAVADRYGFASVTGELDQLLPDEEIDVVSVALPNFLHQSVLTQVLASGKHVFAEKPIGRTVEEASDLARKAQESKAVTGVGFRFDGCPLLPPLPKPSPQARSADRTPYAAGITPTMRRTRLELSPGGTHSSNRVAAPFSTLARTPSMRSSTWPDRSPGCSLPTCEP